MVFNSLHRTGRNEDKNEKKTLLRELADRIAAGSEILEAKKVEREQKKKDEKKKLSLLKQGKDIRLRAMRTLKDGG